LGNRYHYWQKPSTSGAIHRCKGDEIYYIKKITTESSITAKPFFEKMGYQLIKEQNKKCAGVILKNYLMEKILNIELKIDYLKHHIEAIPELASIWYQVLGSIWSPDTSLEKVIKRFEEHLNVSTARNSS
jgi:hypothetical protein